ncbi:hypothetical protein L6452_09562 [Arctium lappa]|uniref:Uncharacterized protein n=1 Tax=Arctium lappa TaxID=4217 RepID=A0ACB9DL11_ARCLA|nr:hypothetical protein L6452_09562 [Arctium lappa]
MVPTISGLSSSSSSYSSVIVLRVNCSKFSNRNLKKIGKKFEVCTTMVQQTTVQGASATYAKEMERLSAKESLLLAFQAKMEVHCFNMYAIQPPPYVPNATEHIPEATMVAGPDEDPPVYLSGLCGFLVYSTANCFVLLVDSKNSLDSSHGSDTLLTIRNHNLLHIMKRERKGNNKGGIGKKKMKGSTTETKFLQELVLYVASAALSCLVLFVGLKHLDPNVEVSKKGLEQKIEISKRLGRPLIQTSPYEPEDFVILISCMRGLE